MNIHRLSLAAGSFLVAAGVAFADATFTYTLSGSQATITGFTTSAAGTGALTIPATVDGYSVVGVARGAFKNRTGLTSVAFAGGATVSALGPQVFQGCTGLTSASLPSGLATVPAGAFLGCSSLGAVTLPSGLVAIEAAAFADCPSLASLSLPTTLSSLGEDAFQNCAALAAVNLPAGLTVLPAHAFDGCRSLASLGVSSGLVRIGAGALANADRLTAVVLPDSVTTIGAGAFRDCDSLASLSLGAGVATLGDGFVAGCSALAQITVASGNAVFAANSGVLFDAARSTLLLAPPALAGSYAVPASVATLAPGAFAHCRNLTAVTLPSGLAAIPEGAFYYATGLTTLEVPAATTTIGAWAFGGCRGLASVTLPAGLTALADDAFHYAGGLTRAVFRGNAPTSGLACFDNTATSFTVYYLPGATGFTTPTWQGYASAVFGVPAVVTEPVDRVVATGATVDFVAEFSGTPAPTLQWYIDGVLAAGHTAANFGAFTADSTRNGVRFHCVATNASGTVATRAALLTVGSPPPAITVSTPSVGAAAGSAATLSVSASNATRFQWFKGGIQVSGATGSSLAFAAVSSADAGIYDCLVSGSGGDDISVPIVLGVVPAAGQRTAGAVTTRDEWQNIVHSNGNVYDQFLLSGAAGTFTADANQIARLSFLDSNGSIVQVEMSGAGAITVVLDGATGPLAPALYNQSGIQYMKGTPTIVLAGADATTHFTIYSVGTATNPGVTRSDVTYAGWANVAVAGIVSTDGKLGGIHQGNVGYNSDLGYTGVYAPGVTTVGGVVVVHEIAATDATIPVLQFASGGTVAVKIAGGSLAQPNEDAVTVDGLAKVTMGAGQDSCGRAAAAQALATRLLNPAGTDVTGAIVGP